MLYANQPFRFLRFCQSVKLTISRTLRFAVLPECRSCPGVSPRRCFAHVIAKSYPIRTVIQLLDVEKQKEPITQSIRNRREHNSRFKMMFYVIGSEDQSRVLLHTAPANRTKGVVEQFGTFGVPILCRTNPTNYVSIWWNISIQLLCSGVPLCHYYTDNVLCRQGCKTLSLYSEFQKANFNGCRKVLS